jgi:phage shock protein PspC (stress-responsive transcriptional regulator)
MRWPGLRSQSRAMNTNTVNPEAPTAATNTEQSDSRPEQRYGLDPGRTGLRRPFQNRMLAGVSAGLARYFDVDVTIVRIAFVVLTIVGGAGIPLYLAGLLLIPDEGSDQSIAGSIIESLQNRNR